MHLMELRLLTMITKRKIKTLPFMVNLLLLLKLLLNLFLKVLTHLHLLLMEILFSIMVINKFTTLLVKRKEIVWYHHYLLLFLHLTLFPFVLVIKTMVFLLWNLLPILLLLMLPKKFLLHLLLLNSSTRCSGNRMQIDLKKKEVGLISHAILILIVS